MIITCKNCNKIFDVDADLIPENGRLLQCNSCKHKWFFKNEVVAKFIESIKDENLDVFETKNYEQDKSFIGDKNLNTNNETALADEKKIDQVNVKIIKDKKKYNILSLIIVFIISFVALIILLDTFKYPLEKIVPNFEFFLYNLYESFYDIFLFVRDLI